MSVSPATALAHRRETFDVCVVGGGMAGLCAAIAAARRGAKTCLIHDRPVLGGNASSEVRMWICGAHGKHNKETGILEEIQLENLYRNPALNYSIWDSVLWGKAFHQPNLTTYLNCSCLDAAMYPGTTRIASVTAWELTSQTFRTISATQFIDCSGDSILAPLTGADCRSGRESRHEFSEDIQPENADAKTMGNTLLIQFRKTDEPQPFTPPKWAYKFTSPADFPHRLHGVQAHNFWWIEVGGLRDTIADAEPIRDELMRVVYGVWDYIKNVAPHRADAENWAVEFIGSLPGKRENRRYIGDHTLTQNDIRAAGDFPDIVAYGGWSMDDHHPAGMYYPGQPTLFHEAPSPYGIPYRCLFSRNIANLHFAGRNISVTHAALSSTRVMATCSILGQAVGTAAALCIQHAVGPRDIHHSHLAALQSALMDDDCWLPGKPRLISALAQSGQLSLSKETAAVLLDGHDRDSATASHAISVPLNEPVTYRWPTPVHIAGVRLTLDSNLLNDKRMPCSYPQKGDRCLVPPTLIKAFRIESLQDNGEWQVIHTATDNYQRLVKIRLNISTRGLRFIATNTWAAEKTQIDTPTARLFTFEPLTKITAAIPPVPDGPTFQSVVARLKPSDLLPPESGLESPTRGHSA